MRGCRLVFVKMIGDVELVLWVELLSARRCCTSMGCGKKFQSPRDYC